jgi:hypothetical protein
MAENAGTDAFVTIGLELAGNMNAILSDFANKLNGVQGQTESLNKATENLGASWKTMDIDFAKAAEVRSSQMNEGVEATLEMQRARKDLSKLEKASAEDFQKAWFTIAEQVDAIQAGSEAGLTKALASGELIRYRQLLGSVQEQMAQGMEELSTLFEDPVSMLDDMASGTIRMEHLSGQQLKKLEEQHEMLKKIQVIDEARIAEGLEPLLEGYEEQVKQLEALGDQAKRLNVLGEIELKNMEKRKSIAKDMRDMGFTRLGDYIEKVTVASVLTKGLKEAVDGLVDSQEKFALAGNRASGTMDQLTAASATLHGQLGITSEEADAAIHSLSKMAVPLKNVRELAISNAAVAVATGASNDQIAKMQRRMMALDMTTGDVNKHMDKLAGAIRRYGLTGEEANEVMSVSEDMLLKLAGSTGVTGDQLAKLTEQFTMLAGAAKRAGVDVSKTLRGAANAAENPLDQIALLGDRFGEWQRAQQEGRGEDAARIRMEALAARSKDLGGNFLISGHMAEAFGSSMEELKGSEKILEAMNSESKDLNKQMENEAVKIFNERMQSLTKQVSQILQTGVAFLKQFLSPFLVAAWAVLWVLNVLITPLRWIITLFEDIPDCIA